ncbi:MAG: VOC family protein [Desulfarculus sp.]|jgi:lactoylglutathione lyase|nr:MAG: VOC family protein [Desulfarculus sp.]
MTFKHDHIHLRCRDLEASIKYYQEMFGGEVVARLQPRGLTLVRMAIGDTFLALSPLREGDPQPSDGPNWGAYELGFLVQDIQRVCQELKAKGAEFIEGPLKVRSGVTVAFLKAPDDMQIELVQRD